jgi:hypothetical protein
MSRSNPWAYSIDYDKEIAGDEARVAYLSNPVVIKAAAVAEELITGKGYSDCLGLDHVLLERPELAEVFGFTREQMRVIMCGADLSLDDEAHALAQQRYGEYQDGDYRAGLEFWRSASLEPDTKWYEWKSGSVLVRPGRVGGSSV